MSSNKIVNFFKKAITSLVLASMLFMSNAPHAHAQLVTANPDLLGQNVATAIQAQAQNKAMGAVTGALVALLINALNFAATHVAQSTAQWIVDGGAGRHPLFNSQTMSEIGESLSATVTSDVIEQLVPGSRYLAALGMNPNDPQVIGLARRFLMAPYVNYADQPVDGSAIGRDFGAYFTSVAAATGGQANRANVRVLNDIANAVNANEFYGLMRVYGQTRARASQVSAMGQFSRVINDGFRDLTDPISGAVRWPAQQVRRQLNTAIEKAQSRDGDTAGNLVAAAGRDAMIQVGINFATTFLSSLFGGLTQKLFDGLLADIDPVTFNPFDPDQVGPSTARQDMFRSLGTFRPLEPSSYSLLSELASCPASLVRGVRGIYTCAMNTSFMSVVSRGSSGAPMTLQQAINEGYIDKNWRLMGSGADLNRDAACHRSAFCYTNLVKMRKARIIPIGWEMAAELSGDGSFTLGQVMEGFRSCNSDGGRDAQHPFCNLIDPNWIIKAPEAICRTLAYGQQLTAPGTENRAEECVDIQSCIAEDSEGNCIGGYGYCIREKNIWRFRGDACDPQYATCQSMVNANGTRVNYLLRSVDYASCGPDEVGCLWYATKKTVDDAGNFDWPIINNVEEDAQNERAYENRTYLKGSVEECDASDAGCTELITRSTDLTLNMLVNPRFNELDGAGRPIGWIFSTDEEDDDFSIDEEDDDFSIIESGAGRFDSNALFGGSDQPYSVTQPGLILQSGYDYTLSFYARGGISSLKLSLVEEETGASFTTNNLRVTSNGSEACRFTDIDGITYLEFSSISSSSFTRFSCTFTAPRTSTLQRNILSNLTIKPIGYIDDIQLQQASNVTNFTANYSSGAPLEYARIAPDYLGCTGGPNDPAECAGFSRMCNPLDEGCRLYTPRNGNPPVTGIVGSNDFCPAACIGYDTFKQEPTNYEPDGLFPVHFIASTADTCPLSAVGCDEFTNLATEQREYFSDLRACQASNEGSASYYTWQGSEESGFQLRVWNLLESNVGNVGNRAPCTNWSAKLDGLMTCEDTTNNIDTSCSSEDDLFTNLDCRQFYDIQGNIHYRLLSKTVTISDQCTRYRKTVIAGNDASAQQNNCESSGGYFDTNNNYCLFTGLPSESQSCTSAQNGCRLYTGGRSNNARIVFQDNLEAGNLANWNTENTADITRSTEALSAGGHSLRSEGTAFWTAQADGGTPCAQIGGCADNKPSLETEVSCTILNGERYCGRLHNQLASGKTYTLSFWARGTGSLSVGFANQDGSNINDLINASFTSPSQDGTGSVALSSEWRQYQLGPLDTSNIEGFGDGTVLHFDPSGLLFIDNIVLREGEENLALIRDSWVTPAVCDTDNSGQFSPQFHLGCQAYDVSSGGTANLKSFARLCSDNAIGCTAYFNTFGKENPHPEVKNALCTRLDDNLEADIPCYLMNNGSSYDVSSPRLCTIRPGQDSCRFSLNFGLHEHDLNSIDQLSHIQLTAETEILPAHKPIYAIVDGANRCNPDNVGCSELGVPSFSADKTTVETWDTAYLIRDMNRMDEILCGEDTLFCSEFDAGQLGTFFFRDPGNQICEYRTNVSLSGQAYSGWFRQGTNDFCYGTGSCSNDIRVACSTDADCRTDDAGTCSVSGNSCSQDADCGSNERCLGTSDGFCAINIPTYLRSGITSGLWNNGDAEYTGWVGTCPENQSGCREFNDPLAVPENTLYGQAQASSYYYIENENIGDRGLSSRDRCNGQVSLEHGCALFHDTSRPEMTFNSSATSIASQHSDIMFAREQFALVDPINCDDGASRSRIDTPDGFIDLCAQRCVYNNFELNDLNGQSINTIPAAIAEVVGPDGELDSTNLDQVYTFAGSCLTDNDCGTMRSDKGDPVTGRCLSHVFVSSDASNTETIPVPRLTNDSNRVLRVNRDRTCSEWVMHDNCQAVWDPELGQFRNSCADLIMCQGYDSGGANTCTKPKLNDASFILDIDYYASRDISWHGNEYSGYAIPGQFLMNQLTQYMISPRNVCVGEDSDEMILNNGQPISCDPSASNPCSSGQVCVPHPDPEYSLVYNAGGDRPEDVPNGASCTVGFCSDTGSPCAGDDSCISGICSIGFCAINSGSCSSSSDCSRDASCIAGTCQSRTGELCGLNGQCATGSVCIRSSSVREGEWVNDRCLLNIDGTRFRTQEAEPAFCRAHPEINSPFGNDLVTQWNRYDVNGRSESAGENSSGPDSSDAFPFNVRSGFEQVNLCGPNEVCECAYKKVSTSGGQSGYMEISNSREALAQQINSERRYNADNPQLGICSGGVADGAFCIIDSDNTEYGCAGGSDGFDPESGITSSNQGTCNAIAREDSLLGLRGYCLERDTSVVVNGNDELGACLTWYPVDELLGDTDLNAKFKSAGYFEDTYQCGDLEIFQSMQSIRGCSTERGNPLDGGFDSGQGQDGPSSPDCKYTAHCPNGFFAVSGPRYTRNDMDNIYAQDCRVGRIVGSGNRPWCPYLCVPIGSVNESGESCTPPSGITPVKAKFTGQSENNILTNNDVYYIEDNDDVREIFNKLSTCTITGLHGSGRDTGLDFPLFDQNPDFFYLAGYVNEISASSRFPKPASGIRSRNTDYQLRWPVVNYYPACSTIVQTSSSDGTISSGVRTNIIHSDKLILENDVTINTSSWGIRRVVNAPTPPFGSVPYSRTSTNRPFPVSSCIFSVSNIVGRAPVDEISKREHWGALRESIRGDEIRTLQLINPPILTHNSIDCRGTLLNYLAVIFSDNLRNVDTATLGLGGRSFDVDVYRRINNNVYSYSLTANIIGNNPLITLPWSRWYGNLLYRDGIDYGSGNWRGSRPYHFDRVTGAESLHWWLPLNQYRSLLEDPSDGYKLRYISTDPASLINNLYAKSIRFLHWDKFNNPSTRRYISDDSEELMSNLDVQSWDTRETDGSPPRVISVDYANCRGAFCREGREGAISVNRQDQGDMEYEGFARVRIEFFAAADKDQLPLRRVIIDWGDRPAHQASRFRGSSQSDNFFRNHRGLDNENNQICNARTEWGMTQESCDPRPMSFSRIYSCTDARVIELDACGDPMTDAPCVEKPFGDEGPVTCVYRPAVHIRDNWGWCAGECDGTAGCFSGQYGLDAASDEPVSQCSYLEYPFTLLQFTLLQSELVDPWIRYNGIIRIRQQ